jgi:FMN phosphatase YigB (HAD superfamily)
VLFVDDSERNVDAASELGLRTVLHTPGQEFAGLPDD